MDSVTRHLEYVTSALPLFLLGLTFILVVAYFISTYRKLNDEDEEKCKLKTEPEDLAKKEQERLDMIMNFFDDNS